MNKTIGNVVAVCRNRKHEFSKELQVNINLIKMFGVEGDAHAGKYVKHRARVKKDPSQINFRQVHLVESESLDDLKRDGYEVRPGELGENITTKGIQLVDLPEGAILKIGRLVRLEITGLRKPCKQIDGFQDGLLQMVISKDKTGKLDIKSGVMSIVTQGGIVTPGDEIEIIYPDQPYKELEFV